PPEPLSVGGAGTEDAVIAQDPGSRLMACAAVLPNLRGGREAMHGVEPPRIEVIFRENLPPAAPP
ncbi:LacI family transcriptional regulator, partial [Azospirillum brasilense]|nr:LacI family transcriptional regulator [Azospirillum brasilense]